MLLSLCFENTCTYYSTKASQNFGADLRADLARLLPIVRKLADEYADVYIPLDAHFDAAMKTQPEPLYYSGDGVHPNDNGRKFIGALYAEAVKPLIK